MIIQTTDKNEKAVCNQCGHEFLYTENDIETNYNPSVLFYGLNIIKSIPCPVCSEDVLISMEHTYTDEDGDIY